ncbi:MAG: 4-hydroxy-tetrahydrodipicolinate reductase [Cyclobacteriaceae bacterium]|nr:4-hydroxy-tetrahydrodipicolinate reductase [Cyclobacteriaceae bacterium]
MRILILGYGKMGKVIEEIAEERGHTVPFKINIHNTQALKFIDAQSVDVAIEFSQPDAAFENIKYCLERGIPVVCGTTGWLDKKKEAEELCLSHNGAFFYASNFSLGVNLFFRLNEILATMMDAHKVYNVGITEIHHTEKLDAPSGTAITLADELIRQLSGKDRWINEASAESEEVSIISKRESDVPGTHIITYSSDVDEIEIKHTAKSRMGLAMGAVLVSEWIIGKKGVFSMKDFMNF